MVAVPLSFDIPLSPCAQEALKEKLRAGKVDFRQYKTLRALLALPKGFDSTDPNFRYLVHCAQKRLNPNGEGGASGASEDEDGDGGRCRIM